MPESPDPYEAIKEDIDDGLGLDYRVVYESQCFLWTVQLFAPDLEATPFTALFNRLQKRWIRDLYLGIARFFEQKGRDKRCLDDLLNFIEKDCSDLLVIDSKRAAQLLKPSRIALTAEEVASGKFCRKIVKECRNIQKKVAAENSVVRKIRNRDIGHHLKLEEPLGALCGDEVDHVAKAMCDILDLIDSGICGRMDCDEAWRKLAQSTGKQLFDFLKAAGYQPHRELSEDRDYYEIDWST